MKKIGWKLAAVVIVAATAAGCAQQSRFVWGNYENSLYTYYKSPDQRAQYEASLVKAIELGKKNGKVAPGLCAELGYLQLENGNLLEAQKDFAEEMTLFPESRPFLSGVVQRMTADKDKADGEKKKETQS
jgi:hypothetical protein